MADGQKPLRWSSCCCCCCCCRRAHTRDYYDSAAGHTESHNTVDGKKCEIGGTRNVVGRSSTGINFHAH